MSEYAKVIDGFEVHQGKVNGFLRCEKPGQATEVKDALNAAYDAGQKDAFNLIRKLLGMKLHD